MSCLTVLVATVDILGYFQASRSTFHLANGDFALKNTKKNVFRFVPADFPLMSAGIVIMTSRDISAGEESQSVHKEQGLNLARLAVFVLISSDLL